jgi:hypothetical protein
MFCPAEGARDNVARGGELKGSGEPGSQNKHTINRDLPAGWCREVLFKMSHRIIEAGRPVIFAGRARRHASGDPRHRSRDDRIWVGQDLGIEVRGIARRSKACTKGRRRRFRWNACFRPRLPRVKTPRVVMIEPQP